MPNARSPRLPTFLPRRPAVTTIVGGSLAALATAERLTAAGHEVDLWLPRHGAGGGFEGLEVAGRRLDLGCRVLELFTAGGDEQGLGPSLDSYAPRTTGHQRQGPFTPRIRAYLDELLDGAIVELPPTRAFVGGAWTSGMIYTSNLSGLWPCLTPRTAAAIADEAAQRCERDGPGGVFTAAVDWSRLTLAEAMERNHGPTFQAEVLGPLLAKIDAEQGQGALAEYRRKLWMPLYWPATLAQAARGEPLGFAPQRPLHYPLPRARRRGPVERGSPAGSERERASAACGGMAEVVDALHARIEASGRARLLRFSRLEQIGRDGEGVRVVIDGRVLRPAGRWVLGASPGAVFAAAGQPWAPRRAPLGLVWFEVAIADLRGDPTTCWVLDADVPAFRISAGGHTPTPGAMIVCVELGHAAPSEPAALAVMARDSLVRTGLLRPDARPLVLKASALRAVAVPTAAERDGFAAALAQLDALALDAEYVGGLAAFAADSLNEQLLQGLATAARLGERPALRPAMAA